MVNNYIMNKILNTFLSSEQDKVFYELSEPIYTNGDWSIYFYTKNQYIYTFKNIAVNCLVGIDKEHLNNLAENKRPCNKHFIFDRAIENLNKGIKLL